MNKTKYFGFISFSLAVLFTLPVHAKSFRVDQLPNGSKSDCATCHVSQTNRSRNPFGLDVDVTLNRNNVDWAQVYFLDSDGDGYSNGRELGDPCGDWRTGRTPERTTDISNPGDPFSVPPGDPGPTCTCGNGILDPDEECDDGNLIHGDRCTNDCQETNCGNGIVDSGELCDDGNEDNTDDCTNTCQTARCGDGFIHVDQEVCDDGNISNSDDCLNSCEPSSCGDGYQWIGQEACDQGANNSDSLPDACRTNCEIANCGDGVTDSEERCDDGSNLDSSDQTLCTSACPQPQCGNGLVEFGEQCDQGAANSNTAANTCREACRNPSCGDFVIDANEACDDGPVGSNGCSSTCTQEVELNNDDSSCSCLAVRAEPYPDISMLFLGMVLLWVRRKLK